MRKVSLAFLLTSLVTVNPALSGRLALESR